MRKENACGEPSRKYTSQSSIIYSGKNSLKGPHLTAGEARYNLLIDRYPEAKRKWFGEQPIKYVQPTWRILYFCAFILLIPVNSPAQLWFRRARDIRTTLHRAEMRRQDMQAERREGFCTARARGSVHPKHLISQKRSLSPRESRDLPHARHLQI